MHYGPSSNRVWSDSATVLTRGNRVFEGSAFESDTELSYLVLRDARSRGGPSS